MTSSRIRPHTSGQSGVLWGEGRKFYGGFILLWCDCMCAGRGVQESFLNNKCAALCYIRKPSKPLCLLMSDTCTVTEPTSPAVMDELLDQAQAADISPLTPCICVYVCVFVRETEREKRNKIFCN